MEAVSPERVAWAPRMLLLAVGIRRACLPVGMDKPAGVNMSVTSDQALASDGALAERTYEPLSVHEIIYRHHDALIRFLRQRLRVKDDAADVAQEAYIRLMQYQGSRQIASPSSMLFRIAINVANDLGRTEQTHRVCDQFPLDLVEIASEQPSADREIAAEQDLQLLYAAIEELPPKCRNVFLLSRVRRMTYPQIASHVGISVKMVEKHISQALAICMRKVGGGGPRSS
jgi:RNA polymerase sigma-70 factor (ECF subfamily)